MKATALAGTDPARTTQRRSTRPIGREIRGLVWLIRHPWLRAAARPGSAGPATPGARSRPAPSSAGAGAGGGGVVAGPSTLLRPVGRARGCARCGGAGPTTAARLAGRPGRRRADPRPPPHRRNPLPAGAAGPGGHPVDRRADRAAGPRPGPARPGPTAPKPWPKPWKAQRVAVSRRRPSRADRGGGAGTAVRAGHPRPATSPPRAELVDLARLDVGDNEYGGPFHLNLLGKHLLVAGASGAGKGSLIWSPLRAMGPAIRDGLIRVHGIDLKGGAELERGRALFHQLRHHPDRRDRPGHRLPRPHARPAGVDARTRAAAPARSPPRRRSSCW